MNTHLLRTDQAEATIAALGAELQSLRLREADLLWPAGPLWPRHAPLLFPVVGGLNGGTLRHLGQAHAMPKHGFARDAAFTWRHRSANACTLELNDDGATRASYPFPFRLTVAYALRDASLLMEVTLHNPGDAPLPASFGLHPAFRWPLLPGLPKAAHRLVFEAEEPGPLRRIDAAGLLTPTLHASPIQHRVLGLHEGLFTDDALLFLEPRSQGLRYEAEGGPALGLRWTGFPHLGVWAKPDLGPSFLCIEPWQGHADPTGWQGEFQDKPGGFTVAPGGSRSWSFDVSQLEP